MGTNFYWRDPVVIAERTVGPWEPDLSRGDPRVHIGKRSAAGQYCWDCDRTLCAGGNAQIHTGHSTWHDRCPQCGQPPATGDGLREGPAAIELGFAAPRVTRPSGVRGASSFSWAQDPERVGATCDARPDDPLIENEYGDLLTGREFLEMLRANCPVQFTDFIGVEFS